MAEGRGPTRVKQPCVNWQLFISMGTSAAWKTHGRDAEARVAGGGIRLSKYTLTGGQ